MGSWARPASIFLAPVLLVVEFLVYNPQGGEKIAEEEEEEGEAAHEHLPLLALRVPGQAEQRQCVKKLPELSKEEEGQQEGEAPPHPGLEALHGQVHGVPLAQGPQAVQTAALVVILEELHKALVHGEGQELVPELLVHEAVGPCQHDSRQERGHVMVENPPAFDPGAVVDEDALADGQGAVIPDQQEVEGGVGHPGVEEEAAGEGDEDEDDGEVELELLILGLVGELSLLAQECHVDVAQNQAQVQPILLG